MSAKIADRDVERVKAVLRATKDIEDEQRPVFLFGLALALVDELDATPELELELERLVLRVQAKVGLWRAERNAEQKAKGRGG